jgi:hypothetical protein
LVLINEAAAAFSTVSNNVAFPLSACKIIKSIGIDKATPLIIDIACSRAKTSASNEEKSASKAGSKFFVIAAADGISLLSQINSVSFVGDMISYISDILLKKYCGIIKAKVMHNHKADFNNSAGEAFV